jgi:hypothetical protein
VRAVQANAKGKGKNSKDNLPTLGPVWKSQYRRISLHVLLRGALALG